MLLYTYSSITHAHSRFKCCAGAMEAAAAYLETAGPILKGRFSNDPQDILCPNIALFFIWFAFVDNRTL